DRVLPCRRRERVLQREESAHRHHRSGRRPGREALLHPANVPVLEQVPGEAPPAPRVLAARSTDEGVQVRWLGHGATSYALWHLPTPEVRDEDLADGRRLVATVRAGRGSQALVHEGADGSGWYAVTAYDRTWRGSRPSQAVAPRR